MIPLTAEQSRLRDEVARLLQRIRQEMGGDDPTLKQISFDELASKAHKLHLLLKKTGHEPRHSRTMLKNRGVPPTDRQFYRHIHPAEDLLKFIDNPASVQPAQDETIDCEFRFSVYSRRWGHDEDYRLRRTQDGWDVTHLTTAVSCNKRGETGLYEQLDHDLINYPKELPDYLGWLWDRAAEDGLTAEEVQAELDRLARWVKICEQNTPAGIFATYK